MSNGYVFAASADASTGAEIAAAFGLDLVESGAITDTEAAAGAFAAAANVGVLLGAEAAADASFAAVLHVLAQRLQRAQLILLSPDARNVFPDLPETWPAMTIEEARARAAEMARRREPAPADTPAAEPPSDASESIEAAAIAPQPEEPEASIGAAEAVLAEAAASELEATAPIEDAAPDVETSAADAETLVANADQDEDDAADADDAPLDVYFSFDADDADAARDMGAALHQRGLHVGGDDPDLVDESKVIVALWSARGAGNAQVRADIETARSSRKLVVAGLDAAPPPPGFEAAPINLSHWRGDAEDAAFQALVARVLGILTRASAPEPAAPAEQPPALAAAPPPRQIETEAPQAPIPPPSAAPGEQEMAAPAPSPGPAAAAPAPQAAKAAREANARTSPAAEPSISANQSLNRMRQRSAPADATAFAPKKLRRGSPELVQIAVHQPKDLRAVTRLARQADRRTEPAPQGVRIGDLPMGASVGVSLEVRGAACDGAIQRQSWFGEPLSFAFALEADDAVKQVVCIARVFVGDAQIGIIAFTRGVTGPKAKAAKVDGGARLKRHKRVFLSYSSKDREIVSAIATAYEMAGVAHFFDRTSLKSGEIWSPRLRREIDRSDLFHLCWSKAAAQSEWVEKEAEHALTRRQRSNGKTPAITVQMLDGPPWAPHPAELDSINFDDFVRAAIVGYARGDTDAPSDASA